MAKKACFFLHPRSLLAVIFVFLVTLSYTFAEEAESTPVSVQLIDCGQVHVAAGNDGNLVDIRKQEDSESQRIYQWGGGVDSEIIDGDEELPEGFVWIGNIEGCVYQAYTTTTSPEAENATEAEADTLALVLSPGGPLAPSQVISGFHRDVPNEPIVVPIGPPDVCVQPQGGCVIICRPGQCEN
ncbi:MAG: hypothetical protein HYR55_20875 [Acidobacteria bacterium]|nr:hypothetical protein [Acidobacteriota bacterium]